MDFWAWKLMLPCELYLKAKIVFRLKMLIDDNEARQFGVKTQAMALIKSSYNGISE